jgi:hypothetical protein
MAKYSQCPKWAHNTPFSMGIAIFLFIFNQFLIY